MSDGPASPGTARIRRAPPPFRLATVQATTTIGPRLRRVTLAGPDLVGFPAPLPAASVRVLVPSPGDPALVLPVWNGNEFLRPDGGRPALRTFTPRGVDGDGGSLEIEVVLHGRGIASEWAAAAAPGAPVAVSGPGRGYAVDPDAPAFLLAGDETALPAIAQLLEAVPARSTVRIHIEIAAPDGRIDLPAHPRAEVTWHELADPTDPGAALVSAVRAARIDPGTRVWVAGEAASVQRIRKHLFDERAFPRSHATVRGYWKRGRASDASVG